MIVAKIQVNGAIAKTVYRKVIPAGIIGAQVELDYDEDIWHGLHKTVVFKGAVTKDVITDANIVTIPHEVVEKPFFRLSIGVYGVDADGNIVIPTLWENIGAILDAAAPSGDTSAAPSLPVWAQIQAMIGDLSNLTTTAKENLVAAINEAAKSGGGGGSASIAMRVDGGYIQYSTDDGKTWVNLIAEADLKGDKGADGKSAYQYAQEGGYTGTEAEFSARMAAEIPTVDTTLSAAGKAADAKAVGDALANISGDGLSKTEKNLILTLFKNAMYTGNMTDTVTALENLWSESGGGEEIVTYTITNTLSNVTSNNSATSATAGSAYSATLTANDGYTMNTVTVLMGGVDVTDSVYSNGAITIGSVTGNVSITATAVEASSAANWENGVAYTFTDLVENEYVDHATGEFKAYANYYRTGYVPCFGAAWLKFTDNGVYAEVAFYDSSKAFISGVKLNNTSGYFNVPANSAYFAISAKNGVNWTVIPYAGIEATWEDGVPYTPTIIENSYVNNNANNTFVDYNGWNRTDYLNCVGANTIEASISTQYFAFFDVNEEHVVGMRNDKTYTVPVGACYFIISETAANMASIVITPHA